MTLSLSITGKSLPGKLWALPGFVESLEPVRTYLSSAWPMWVLFFIGIGIGFLFRAMRKSKFKSIASEPAVPDASTAETDDEAEKRLRAERKLIAELEGELNVERRHVAQQQQDLEAVRSRLESVRRQRDEEQARFETLSEMLEAVSESGGGSGRSLAQARAPVIRLDELVQLERQHLGGGLERLGDLEARLSNDSRALWTSVESAAALRGKVEAAFAGRENPAAELMERVGVADEHLRVFYQNVQGCLQRIATTKLRIQSEDRKLEKAAGPIADAEAALAELAASEVPPDEDGIEAAFDRALDRLSESRPAIASLENGIDQEIAELTGRIDWVIRDSPKNYLTAVEELDGIEPPSDRELNEPFNEIWRHLTVARQILVGIDLPLDGNAFGESEYNSGKHRVVDAFESAVAMMKSAKVAPPSLEADKPAKSEGRIAHLERQLALRESETAGLDQKLKLTGQELLKLREENEQLGKGIHNAGLTAEPPVGGNFVRRLLGLGPGSPEESSCEVSEIRESASAVTLAEAREILNELKLVSTNGSGNGGRESAAESREKDSPIPEATIEDFPSVAEGMADSSASELEHLHEKIARQKMRIEELEASLSKLRKAAQSGTSSPTRDPGPDVVIPIIQGDLESETAPEIGAQPSAEESQNEARVPDSGLIVFRSNNPAIWGENTYSGANCRSRALDDLPEDIAWLRIRSLPGGESVILPVTKVDLTRNGDGLIRGFNGANELFYGARHLGAFDESLPQEVETRFTYGGWGFGHCPTGTEEQACGWAGREIDKDTVFEFTVYRQMPYIDDFLDRVLEG